MPSTKRHNANSFFFFFFLFGLVGGVLVHTHTPVSATFGPVWFVMAFL
jgi:hypothetical protein